MFIVFEGTDGSGTSTQAAELSQRLQQKGMKVLQTAEPSSSFLGKILRETLQKKHSLSAKAFQLLFFAEREEHLQNEILPALARGEVVICERYCWSSIAYGQAEGVEKEVLESLSSSFLSPDYTFFMNLPADISISRIETRGEEKEYFETEDTLSLVRSTMIDLAERCAFTKRATVLDASESIEQISSRIDMVLAPILFTEFFTAKDL